MQLVELCGILCRSIEAALARSGVTEVTVTEQMAPYEIPEFDSPLAVEVLLDVQEELGAELDPAVVLELVDAFGHRATPTALGVIAEKLAEALSAVTVAGAGNE